MTSATLTRAVLVSAFTLAVSCAVPLVLYALVLTLWKPSAARASLVFISFAIAAPVVLSAIAGRHLVNAQQSSWKRALAAGLCVGGLATLVAWIAVFIDAW